MKGWTSADIKASSWSDLFRSVWFLLGEKRKRFIFWETILFLVNFYVIIPPLLLGKIVDFFVAYRPGMSVTPFYFYISVFGLSYALISFFRLTLKNILGNIRSDIGFEIKVKGFEKLLDFSLRWHDEEITGNKVQRIQNGSTSFYNFSNIFDNEIMRTLTTFLGTVMVFIFLKPPYVIFFILYIAVYFFLLKAFLTKQQKMNDEYYESLEKAGGSYIEGLSNILTIKTLGASENFKTHISGKEEITKNYEYKIRRIGTNLWKAYQALSGISYAVFLLLVGNDVLTKSISVGSIVIFAGYFQSLLGGTNEITGIYEKFIQAKAGIARVMPILWAKARVREGNLSFPENWNKITIQKAGFKYRSSEKKKESEEKDLSDINLTIDKFQKIGIVGKTGSGKSTLAKLLVGLYEFDSGVYRIDKVDFYSIRHEEVLKNMALVLQDSEMFNLSLRDNITLMREVDTVLLQKVIEIAQLNEVVAKLLDGLDTLIGEKGYHLSGGERQRIGIARAIYKNPQIIILDEATSSLDRQTEQKLQQALEKNLKNKTIITIAHRVSTLEKADNIYVFDEGRIFEQGSFEKL